LKGRNRTSIRAVVWFELACKPHTCDVRPAYPFLVHGTNLGADGSAEWPHCRGHEHGAASWIETRVLPPKNKGKDMNPKSEIKLHTGNKMPVLGLGT
jgi:hypothetical protein